MQRRELLSSVPSLFVVSPGYTFSFGGSNSEAGSTRKRRTLEEMVRRVQERLTEKFSQFFTSQEILIDLRKSTKWVAVVSEEQETFLVLEDICLVGGPWVDLVVWFTVASLGYSLCDFVEIRPGSLQPVPVRWLPRLEHEELLAIADHATEQVDVLFPLQGGRRIMMG